MVNVQGNVILPGMHDVHIHPLESGSEVGGTCMLTRNVINSGIEKKICGQILLLMACFHFPKIELWPFET